MRIKGSPRGSTSPKDGDRRDLGMSRRSGGLRIALPNRYSSWLSDSGNSFRFDRSSGIESRVDRRVSKPKERPDNLAAIADSRWENPKSISSIGSIRRAEFIDHSAKHIIAKSINPAAARSNKTPTVAKRDTKKMTALSKKFGGSLSDSRRSTTTRVRKRAGATMITRTIPTPGEIKITTTVKTIGAMTKNVPTKSENVIDVCLSSESD